jgi:hypothetical protein
MPLYNLGCKCGYADEKVVWPGEAIPNCPDCGEKLEIKYTSGPPMIKYKGEGGYPSRHKQWFNTTKRNHPKLND